ncbi:TRAP transporter large permease subunit [Parasalinivibrio latis]|uniref:TRAP transporter large permease n=1 Tax=Parasalinivibrio latis TaxID=2952610 RepID=UPI0030E351A1
MKSAEVQNIEANKPDNTFESVSGYLEKLVTSLVIFLLGFMSILITYSVITRYFFSNPSSLSEELLRFSLIWLGMLGAGVCVSKGMHLNLPILLDAVSDRTKNRLNIINALITIIFGCALTFGGYIASVRNIGQITPMLHVPIGVLQTVIIFLGIFVILFQVRHAIKQFKDNYSTLSDVLFAFVVVSLVVLSVMFIFTNDYFNSLVDDNLELVSTVVLFVSFFTFLFIGTPIAIGLAISGILTLGIQIDFTNLIVTSSEKLFSGLDSFGFLALPFFVLAGNIMNQGGIAQRLLDLAMLLGRSIPGNLWQSNIIANMMFGSLSGSSLAAATAIGGIVAPMAKEKGYDNAMTTVVNAASAPTGMLIPPTGVFIVFSLITGGGASIAALFLAGYIPGIIMGLAVMITCYAYARKHKYPVDNTQRDFSEIVQVFLRALPSLALVMIVIGGIVGGVFTATEGSGIAVLYSFILALCYRSMTVSSFVEVLRKSALTSSIVLFLIACSGLMSWSMTFADIPTLIGETLVSISDNKYVVLLLINITLLVVGTFMDLTPAMLIFTPIFYPVAVSLGVDPVHFGALMVYNLCLGVVTPPVGAVLFVSCGITGEKITNTFRPLMPVFFMQVIGLLLVTYIPALSLFLPNLFGL